MQIANKIAHEIAHEIACINGPLEAGYSNDLMFDFMCDLLQIAGAGANNSMPTLKRLNDMDTTLIFDQLMLHRSQFKKSGR
jgi:hypothetical protein